MLIADWFLSGLRISLPLIFAAMGGLLCEKSGVANIALEAFLLFSSFTAAAVMATTHNIALSVFSGILASFFVGIIFAFFTVKAKSDQIIVGTGLNIWALGLIPVLCKAFYGESGQTPSLTLAERFSNQWFFVFAAAIAIGLVTIVLRETPFGLHITASGDHPGALRTQGGNVEKTRWLAILLGSVIISFGGIYLSIGAGSGYTRNMSAGRGFIALTALIFGRWKPVPTLLACLFFGLLDALQIFIQNIGDFQIPTQLTQSLPYIFTLVALAIFSSKNAAPKAINQAEL